MLAFKKLIEKWNLYFVRLPWVCGDVVVDINDIKDKILMWIAWKLPRQLVMWCAYRLIANATQGKYSAQVVPELTAMDALQRWDWNGNEFPGTRDQPPPESD